MARAPLRVDDAQRQQRLELLLTACQSGHRARRAGRAVKRRTAMRKTVLFLLVAGCRALVAQQRPGPDVAAQREAMKKLDFMVGKWEGSGWDQRGRVRHEFTSAETVDWRVDGTVLLVEGRHKTAD